MLTHGYLTHHFRESELGCPCVACGRTFPDDVRPALMELCRALDVIRAEFGEPLRVTSGYRCASHNAQVGGQPGSLHTKGLAADLAPMRGSELTVRDLHADVLFCAEVERSIPDGGVGRYSRHVHYDIRPKRARWVGTYGGK